MYEQIIANRHEDRDRIQECENTIQAAGGTTRDGVILLAEDWPAKEVLDAISYLCDKHIYFFYKASLSE